MAETIRLHWIRDNKGYEIRSHPHWGSEYIVSKSGWRRKPKVGELYELKGLHNNVATDLANTASTIEGAIEFASRWGLLWQNELLNPKDTDEIRLEKFDLCGDPLDYFFKRQDFVRQLLVDFENENFRKWEQFLSKKSFLNTEQPGMGKFSVNIHVPPGTNTPNIYLNPATLFDFILMEICQTGARGGKLRTCPHCGKFFTVGPGTPFNEKRVYDTDACKIAFSRAQKNSGKQR